VFTSSGETGHHSPVSPFYQSLLLCLLQNGHLLGPRHGMQVRLLLLGEREESPGKFPNGTANDPAQRVLLSAEVEVVLSACFEQIKQLVFGVDKLLRAGEIVPPATLIPLAEFLRVEDDQGFCIRAQRAVRGQHPAMLCNFLVICRGAIVQDSFLCLTCGSPAAMMRGVESLDWLNNS
jgi:hypothetical protein